jgi:hypothetical protein
MGQRDAQQGPFPPGFGRPGLPGWYVAVLGELFERAVAFRPSTLWKQGRTWLGGRLAARRQHSLHGIHTVPRRSNAIDLFLARDR